VKDLAAVSKFPGQSGRLNVASAGIGTGISIELFKLMAGVKMTHVPYKGR
jgi:tripartite-type tricarboxylate transporter receptor subunit TctC